MMWRVMVPYYPRISGNYDGGRRFARLLARTLQEVLAHPAGEKDNEI